VATQSVANLGVLLDARFTAHRELLLFACLTLWLTGGMLYIWMISLVFYRYTFFQFPPSDLSPPYWINMGAMAISTLTGTALIRHAAEWSFLERLLPFLHGFTLFFWGTATWWIPMLVILGVWRHVYKRFRITYDPLYWGGVFPLGMYGACTYRLAQVSGIGELTAIARLFSFAALAAWAAASFGLVRSLWRNYYAHAIGAGVGELVA
jgi:tellurite resistance protein TehA-like permease